MQHGVWRSRAGRLVVIDDRWEGEGKEKQLTLASSSRRAPQALGWGRAQERPAEKREARQGRTHKRENC